MNMTDYSPHLVPRLRKHGTVSPLPHMSSWHNVLIKRRDINCTILGKDR